MTDRNSKILIFDCSGTSGDYDVNEKNTDGRDRSAKGCIADSREGFTAGILMPAARSSRALARRSKRMPDASGECLWAGFDRG